MFVTLFVLIVTLKASNGITLPYQDVSCSKSQYFQYSSLKCVACGADKTKSPDSLSCVCDSGFKITKYNGGPDLTCKKCAPQEVASRDGWNCIKCANGFDDITGSCHTCGKGKVAVDRFQNGSFYSDDKQTCLTCLEDTWPFSLNGICRRCDPRVLELTGQSAGGVSCDCPETIRIGGVTLRAELSDGICFLKTDLITNVPNLYTIRYSNLQTVESSFFRKHLRAARALCSKYQNFTSCQLLGNLCVMYMYNEDNYINKRISSTDACKEYLLLVDGYKLDIVQNLRDWPSTMPWLYYRTALPLKTDINTKFERMQIMKFVLVSYHANGTFIGLNEDATVLQMCSRPRYISNQAFLFSTPYVSKCKIKLKDLLTTWDTIFYDLYLLLGDNLYPVPVLVENIKMSGVNINLGSDMETWRLTRRFFLVDNLSGRTNLDEDPAVLQYAKEMEIYIRLRDGGKIYPPLLKINYGVVDVNNAGSDDEVSVSFQMSYQMDTDEILKNIQIAAGVLSVLAVAYASIHIFSYRKRQGIHIIDCSSIFIFLLYSCNALAFVFVILIVGICIHWLFFFKQQTSVIRFLPTNDQDDIIEALFIAAFVMKAISIIYLLYTQIDIDIFFIDWERPQAAPNTADEQRKPASVSIMRTLFVANEWRELQTTRKIDPMLLILILLFFLKVVGFENWTTTDPIYRLTVDPSVSYVGEINFTLRIAVICLLYLIIAVILWVIFSFIYERFVADQIGDFIDFCSMSNISVFIMSHFQFGYYIHGLSVHGHSDTNLHQLYEQFQREEDNLCGTRGLEPNSEIQTFEVGITRRFRSDYDKILQLMMNRETIQTARREQLPARQNPGLPHSVLPAGLESSVHAYNLMNKYLSSFIEHSIRDNTYIVKDKTFSEKVFQNELFTPTEQCVFYKDENRSFTSILLYGQEWNFLMFNLLLFLMIDWLANYNAVLAAVIVYFFDIFVITLRDFLGKRNLSTKTMVHERFLI